jgi:hypothetical protein
MLMVLAVLLAEITYQPATLVNSFNNQESNFCKEFYECNLRLGKNKLDRSVCMRTFGTKKH